MINSNNMYVDYKIRSKSAFTKKPLNMFSCDAYDIFPHKENNVQVLDDFSIRINRFSKFHDKSIYKKYGFNSLIQFDPFAQFLKKEFLNQNDKIKIFRLISEISCLYCGVEELPLDIESRILQILKKIKTIDLAVQVDYFKMFFVIIDVKVLQACIKLSENITDIAPDAIEIFYELFENFVCENYFIKLLNTPVIQDKLFKFIIKKFHKYTEMMVMNKVYKEYNAISLEKFINYNMPLILNILERTDILYGESQVIVFEMLMCKCLNNKYFLSDFYLNTCLLILATKKLILNDSAFRKFIRIQNRINDLSVLELWVKIFNNQDDMSLEFCEAIYDYILSNCHKVAQVNLIIGLYASLDFAVSKGDLLNDNTVITIKSNNALRYLNYINYQRLCFGESYPRLDLVLWQDNNGKLSEVACFIQEVLKGCVFNVNNTLLYFKPLSTMALLTVMTEDEYSFFYEQLVPANEFDKAMFSILTINGENYNPLNLNSESINNIIPVGLYIIQNYINEFTPSTIIDLSVNENNDTLITFSRGVSKTTRDYYLCKELVNYLNKYCIEDTNTALSMYDKLLFAQTEPNSWQICKNIIWHIESMCNNIGISNLLMDKHQADILNLTPQSFIGFLAHVFKVSSNEYLGKLGDGKGTHQLLELIVDILRDDKHVITVKFKTQIGKLENELTHFQLYVEEANGCGNIVANEILQYYMDIYQS